MLSSIGKNGLFVSSSQANEQDRDTQLKRVLNRVATAIEGLPKSDKKQDDSRSLLAEILKELKSANNITKSGEQEVSNILERYIKQTSYSYLSKTNAKNILENTIISIENAIRKDIQRYTNNSYYNSQSNSSASLSNNTNRINSSNSSNSSKTTLNKDTRNSKTSNSTKKEYNADKKQADSTANASEKAFRGKIIDFFKEILRRKYPVASSLFDLSKNRLKKLLKGLGLGLGADALSNSGGNNKTQSKNKRVVSPKAVAVGAGIIAGASTLAKGYKNAKDAEKIAKANGVELGSAEAMSGGTLKAIGDILRIVKGEDTSYTKSDTIALAKKNLLGGYDPLTASKLYANENLFNSFSQEVQDEIKAYAEKYIAQVNLDTSTNALKVASVAKEKQSVYEQKLASSKESVKSYKNSIEKIKNNTTLSEEKKQAIIQSYEKGIKVQADRQEELTKSIKELGDFIANIPLGDMRLSDLRGGTDNNLPTDVNQSLKSFMYIAGQIESNGNYNQKANAYGYTGKYQFRYRKSTDLGTIIAKKLGYTPQEIQSSPQKQDEVMAEAVKMYDKELTANGLQVNNLNRYIVHNQGIGTAKQIIGGKITTKTARRNILNQFSGKTRIQAEQLNNEQLASFYKNFFGNKYNKYARNYAKNNNIDIYSSKQANSKAPKDKSNKKTKVATKVTTKEISKVAKSNTKQTVQQKKEVTNTKQTINNKEVQKTAQQDNALLEYLKKRDKANKKQKQTETVAVFTPTNQYQKEHK